MDSSAPSGASCGKGETVQTGQDAPTEPIFRTLAPKNGSLHVGPSGAGHFVKMIHNGIEYGMLQAYAEGFELLKASDFDLDLARISTLWNQGSVVRSWLLELAERAFQKDPDLSSLKGCVEDSGEGRWTILQSIEKGVPAPGLGPLFLSLCDYPRKFHFG